MTVEHFAEWLRLQGFRVTQTESTYWYSQGMGVYQAFPYQNLIVPSTVEISSLFKKEKALALRFSSPPESDQGCMSSHLLCRDSNYGLENLGYRTRKNVRRGFRNCTVQPIEFEKLLAEGWDLHMATLTRQRRGRVRSQAAWTKSFKIASRLAGFEAWGALINQKLAAYMVTFLMGDCCHILDQKCDTALLNTNINNALSFYVTQTLLKRPDVREVFYGMESLDAPPSVTEFKLHMGYEARPVRQHIRFHPFVSPFLNSAVYSAARYAASMFPENRALSKAAGMLRFCLAGEK